MIRTLLIITGASLVLCVAALGGAAALGSRDIARHGGSWTFWEDGEPHTVRVLRGDRGPRVTRSLAWEGGDRLDVEVAAEVTYVQGGTASVVVSGPKEQVEALRLAAGRLTFDDDDGVDHVVFGWATTCPCGSR